MKLNLIKLLSFSLFGISVLYSGQAFGQEDVVRPGSDQKIMKSESAKPSPTNNKGEYTKDAECVDLLVKKGCVNYSVCAAGEKNCEKAPKVKVCSGTSSDSKPTNICKKGAKKIIVKYEKLDANAEFEFREVKGGQKQK